MSKITCFEWEGDKIRCSITRERSLENFQYLDEMVSKGWIANSLGYDGFKNHPFLRTLSQCEPDSYLRMNLLVEDLRILANCDGLSTVINDLKKKGTSLAALHVIHSAANFARGVNQEVTRFYNQNEETNPDFEVNANGNVLAVEAKRFVESESQLAFADKAKIIVDDIVSNILHPNVINPVVVVILRNPEIMPPHNYLLECVRTAIKGFRGSATLLTDVLCNVIVTPINLPLRSLSDYRSCHVISKRSENECLRVESRAKKASKQLSDIASSGGQGILCLGLNTKQTKHEVEAILTSRFERCHYSNISSVLFAEPACIVDTSIRTIVTVAKKINNPNAKVTPQPFTIGSLNGICDWDKLIEECKVLPVYNYGTAIGKTTGPDASLPCLDLRTIRADLLW